MPVLSGLFTRSSRLKLARELENARLFSDAPFSWDWDVRRDQYKVWQSLYDNTIYDSQIDGGFRETILRDLFNVTCNADETVASSEIGPYFNPVKPIVDAYQNVLLGAFGREIRVAPEYNGQPVTPELARPANNPLGRIWRWSNLDTEKQTLQRQAAGLGACGIRIVADAGAEADSRVTLQFDHPGRIKDFDTNSRGDVTAVLLQYTVLAGPLGEGRRDVEVEERIDKEGFSLRYNGEVVKSGDNPFGFCPYVILRHGNRGEYGVPAFAGSETQIHLINRLRAYIARGVPDVVDATWFATAGGPKPEAFSLGRSSVAYVRTDPDSPNPTLEPLVAPLSIAEASAYADRLEELVQQRQPEMLIGNVKLLSGISGETLAKVLKPAESKILEARAPYEHAIIRALQMALSEMIVMGLWNAGTGTGTMQAADAAYQQGRLNFEFEARAALPPTAYDEQNQAKAEDARAASKFSLAKQAQGLGVDEETVLKTAGYSDDEVTDILTKKRTADVIPTEPL